jgi:hypothetical protein
LRSANSSTPSIPYMLKIGDTFSSSNSGVFLFPAFGMTTRGGRPLSVNILLGDIPSSARPGTYSDTLVFGVSAN